MAASGMGNYSSLFFPGRLSNSDFRRRFFLLGSTSRFIPQSVKGVFAARVNAATSTALVETKPDPIMDEFKLESCKDILACPICHSPLISDVDSGSSLDSPAGTKFQCRTCRKAYFEKDTHIDLTITGGSQGYGETRPASTELFRLPLVSFLYERGWRQSFNIWGGFPGAQKEFELMKDYLNPVSGGKIVDASCGSGLFSRLFAKSGLFSLVVALDFSEAMLRQCSEFIKQDEDLPKENIILVRADISRLPFASGSVDAVHAGAALHCWPSPSAAVAEISRVLRPGGVFVATTYILDGPFSYFPLLGPAREAIAQFSGSHIFLSNKELEDLCTTCGLVDFKVTRNRMFVMISTVKPQ
ncbi:OLC1v1017433C1 [Oldenlandia corymbosa var. corymbosa]|uniref:OLC1v1017433C1 n=1 Tax=Oldenlandia corymbosa var. corymbosa TaxID=529605 RepID=A0AAV1E9L5_OLDCO|nr:OLC1v1017433C1 [Oldenlandia corymbosa var. corymbosa]